MLNIYEQAKEKMAPAEIDHWQSDLYLKKTPVSELLVKAYDYKGLVSTFVDEINHEPWFDIPVAYAPFWEPLLKNEFAGILKKLPYVREITE